MPREDFDFDQAALALTKLVDAVLAEPSLRERFRKDPAELAAEQGIELGPIPDRVIDTLASLSVEELRLLNELNTVFKQEGLKLETGSSLMVF
jgi:hypothetical protein